MASVGHARADAGEASTARLPSNHWKDPARYSARPSVALTQHDDDSGGGGGGGGGSGGGGGGGDGGGCGDGRSSSATWADLVRRSGMRSGMTSQASTC